MLFFPSSVFSFSTALSNSWLWILAFLLDSSSQFWYEFGGIMCIGKHPITGSVATTTFFTPRRLIRCRSAASCFTSPSVKAGRPYHIKKYKLERYMFSWKHTCKTFFLSRARTTHIFGTFFGRGIEWIVVCSGGNQSNWWAVFKVTLMTVYFFFEQLFKLIDLDCEGVILPWGENTTASKCKV